VGIVSRTHVVPISSTQDTAGPMSRTVRDAALLLTAIAGEDKADPVTLEAKRVKDYTEGLDSYSLQGVRIGVMRGRKLQCVPLAKIKSLLLKHLLPLNLMV
jgi:amidase